MPCMTCCSLILSVTSMFRKHVAYKKSTTLTFFHFHRYWNQQAYHISVSCGLVLTGEEIDVRFHSSCSQSQRLMQVLIWESWSRLIFYQLHVWKSLLTDICAPKNCGHLHCVLSYCNSASSNWREGRVSLMSAAKGFWNMQISLTWARSSWNRTLNSALSVPVRPCTSWLETGLLVSQLRGFE